MPLLPKYPKRNKFTPSALNVGILGGTNNYANSGGGLAFSNDTGTTVNATEIHQAPVTSAILDLIVNTFSTIPLKTEVTLPNGRKLLKSELPKQFTNPWLHVTTIDLIKTSVLSHILYGSSVSILQRLNEYDPESEIIGVIPCDMIYIGALPYGRSNNPNNFIMAKDFDLDTYEAENAIPNFTYLFIGKPIPNHNLVLTKNLPVAQNPFGINRLNASRDLIGIDIMANKYLARWYRDSFNPSLHIKVQGLSTQEEVLTEMYGRINALYTGTRRYVVTDEKTEFVPIQVNASEAQFEEQRNRLALQLCSLFRVPPQKMGATLTTSQSFNTLEATNQAFVDDCLLPIAIALEEAWTRTGLWGKNERPKFDFSELLRGDTETVSLMMTNEVAKGITTLEEAREILGRDPKYDSEAKSNFEKVLMGGNAEKGGDNPDTAPKKKNERLKLKNEDK